MLTENQPLTLEAVAVSFADPWTPREQVVEGDRHGDREERRTEDAESAVVAYLAEPEVGAEEEKIGDWPGLGQVCRLHREVEYVSGRRAGERTSDWAYALTSLMPAQADPSRLLHIWRGQWQIENGLDSSAGCDARGRCEPDSLWAGSCCLCGGAQHGTGADAAGPADQRGSGPAALCDVSLGSAGIAGYYRSIASMK